MLKYFKSKREEAVQMELANTSSSNSSSNLLTTQGSFCPSIDEETTLKGVQTTAYCIVLLLSLVGNTLIILVVYRNPRMWNTSNYLIVNMAASDLLLPFFAVPRMIVEVLAGRERWLIGGTAGLVLCKLAYFLQDVSTAVSVQSLLAITAERFYAVMYPLKATSMKSNIRYIIPIIWLTAAGLHAPYLQVFKFCLDNGNLYCCQRWTMSVESQLIYFVFNPQFGVWSTFDYNNNLICGDCLQIVSPKITARSPKLHHTESAKSSRQTK